MIKRLAACLIASIVGISSSQASVVGRWGPSVYDGEAEVAAMGCSPVWTDDVYTCLVVRCDEGRLNLYVDMIGASRLEEWVLDVDGQHFPVRAQLDLQAKYYALKVTGEQDAMIKALRTGSVARIVYGPEWGFDEGNEVVPLRGSSAAIDRVERSCVREGGAAATGPAAGELLAIDVTVSTQLHAPFDDAIHEAADLAFRSELSSISSEEGIPTAAVFDKYGRAEMLALGTPPRPRFSLSLSRPPQCGVFACSALVDADRKTLLLEVDGSVIDPLNSSTNGMQDMVLHGARPNDYTVWSFDGARYEYSRELPADQLEAPYWLQSDVQPTGGTSDETMPAVELLKSPREPHDASAPAPSGSSVLRTVPPLEPITLQDLPPIDPTSANARGVVHYNNAEYDKALALFLEGADAGDASAMTNAAIMLLSSRFVAGDLNHAHALLQEAADKGDGFAMVHLANIYFNGLHVPGDFERSTTLYRRALQTVAAPEAASRAYNAVYFGPDYHGVDYQAYVAEGNEICELTMRAGHRMGILNCTTAKLWFSDQTEANYAKGQDLALGRCAWHSGMNISDYYVFDVFWDNNELLYNYAYQFRKQTIRSTGYDVTPFLAGGIIAACPEGERAALAGDTT